MLDISYSWLAREHLKVHVPMHVVLPTVYCSNNYRY